DHLREDMEFVFVDSIDRVLDEALEPAQAALSWVRSSAHGVLPGLAADWFAEHDLHIHVPAGAIPKDGPSAGVTMAVALVSLLSGRPVRSEVAMTGEITLTGQVLPIGGLKEKALAAQRAEIRRVIAPKLNEADVDEIPDHLREDMEFVFVDSIDRVLDEALEPAQAAKPRPALARRPQRERAAARGR
ncbi:MAG: hypothetical protein JOZ25_01825, partial [Actinobacteria bacterium]|nr:hypothetical protein [Actinomycetota bacterium]